MGALVALCVPAIIIIIVPYFAHCVCKMVSGLVSSPPPSPPLQPVICCYTAGGAEAQEKSYNIYIIPCYWQKAVNFGLPTRN